jgi:hypothetical protein
MGQKICSLALLCAVVLCGSSCDLPEGPNAGKETGTETEKEIVLETEPDTVVDTGAETGVLILNLPGTKTSAAGKTDGKADGRAVISNALRDALEYRITLTHADGSLVSLETGGGDTAVSLKVGAWTIDVEAYDPAAPGTTVGSSHAPVSVTIVAGETTNAGTIYMELDPAYETTLTEIYIHNEADLRRVAAGAFAIDGSIDFYLEDDIVLEEPWTPIGSPGEYPAPDEPFKAVFDGQGHSITVKSFSGAKKADNFVFQGFFALVEDATIKNININYELSGEVDISTGDGGTYYDSWVGGIAGKAGNTSFENIGVTGNFSVIFDGNSGLRIGGIAGEADTVTITGCHVTGTVGGTSANYLAIGGIAGMINNGSAGGGDIRGTSFAGTIMGNAPNGNGHVGGLAGYTDGVEITACSAEGHIKAEADGPSAGGIAGVLTSGNINQSYAAGIIGSVTATGDYSEAGGIAGQSDGTIENCYAWADVSTSSLYSGAMFSSDKAGGIAGTNYGTISKCYAAGMVKARGQNNTFVGGIAGDTNISASINNCIALVSELDGGSSTYTRTAYAISALSGGTLNDNYAPDLSGSPGIGVVYIHNNTNASDQGPSNAQDGEARSFTAFKNQTLYTSAGWDFGGVWKFISGWDYPVLKWQDAAPGAGMDAADVEVEIEWL